MVQRYGSGLEDAGQTETGPAALPGPGHGRDHPFVYSGLENLFTMNDLTPLEFSYFPGCSVATTATESNQSLMKACQRLGFHLLELEDWNCCGSSPAHTIDPELGFNLAARILSLAPPDKPLLIMCPRCL